MATTERSNLYRKLEFEPRVKQFLQLKTYTSVFSGPISHFYPLALSLGVVAEIYPL